MLRVLWSLAGKPLCVDRRRATLSVSGIALGIALVYSVNLSVSGARESIGHTGSFMNSADWEISSRFGEPIPEEFYGRTLNVPGAVVLPVIVRTVRLEPEKREILYIGTDLVKLPYFLEAHPDERMLHPTLEVFLRPSVYASAGLKNLHFRQGGTELVLTAPGAKSERVRVLGILPERAFPGEFLIGDIAQAQQLFGFGTVDRILVRVTNRESTESVREAFQDLLSGDLRLQRPTDRILRTEEVIRSFDYNLKALSFMGLLIGMFLVYNTIFISVVRRRTEIGILRALGLTRREVMGLFVLEAGILGFAGSVIGVLLGGLFSSISDQGVIATLRSLYHVQVMNSSGNLLRGMPFPFMVGLAGSMAASLGPAYEASRIPPAETMREGTYESRKQPRFGWMVVAGATLMVSGLFTAFRIHVGRFPYMGFLGLFISLAGFVLMLPGWTAWAARGFTMLRPPLATLERRLGALNLLRSVGRTSMAVSAIAVSFACTIGILMLIHSFRKTVEDWVDGNLSADVYIKAESCQGKVFCDETLDAGILDRLRRVPGVREVYAFRSLEFEFKGQTTHIGTGDISLLHRHSRVRYLGEPDTEQIVREMTQGPYAIVSEPFAYRFGIKRGDPIPVPTRKGEVVFTVSAVFYDYSTELGYMIIDRRWLEPLFGISDAHTLGLYLDPGVPRGRVDRAIREALGGQKVVFLEARELRAAVLAIFDRTFAVTRAIYVIALIIALLAVANSLFALVMEQRRDLSVLRYLGMDRGQLFRMIFFESGAIALAGAVSGLLAGFPIGLVLIYVINRQSFGWSVEFHLPAMAIGGMFAAMIAIPLCSSWFPFLLAGRMHPSEHISTE